MKQQVMEELQREEEELAEKEKELDSEQIRLQELREEEEKQSKQEYERKKRTIKNQFRKEMNKEKSKTFYKQQKASKKPVEEEFQDLGYLKKVTRRVDCWLEPDKKGRQSVTPRNQSVEKEEHALSYFQDCPTHNNTFLQEPKSRIGMGTKFANKKRRPRISTEGENTYSTISLSNSGQKANLKKKAVKQFLDESKRKMSSNTSEDGSSMSSWKRKNIEPKT